MKNTTWTDYLVTWKSPKQRTRKESLFGDIGRAQDFFAEKVREDKKPEIYARIQSTTYAKII